MVACVTCVCVCICTRVHLCAYCEPRSRLIRRARRRPRTSMWASHRTCSATPLQWPRSSRTSGTCPTAAAARAPSSVAAASAAATAAAAAMTPCSTSKAPSSKRHAALAAPPIPSTATSSLEAPEQARAPGAAGPRLQARLGGRPPGRRDDERRPTAARIAASRAASRRAVMNSAGSGILIRNMIEMGAVASVRRKGMRQPQTARSPARRGGG